MDSEDRPGREGENRQGQREGENRGRPAGERENRGRPEGERENRGRPEGENLGRSEGNGQERGREAESPGEIPHKGWRDVLKRTWREIQQDNMSMVAAGVAFYGLLAIFPALAALVSIYGLFADRQDVARHVQELSQIMPGEALRLIQQQLHDLVTTPQESLSIGAAGGILLALWSAMRGVTALMTAINIAYDERESRGLFRRYALAMAMTLAGVVMAIVALALVAGVPPLLDNLGLTEPVRKALSILRWPILAGGMIVALAVLYRFGPSRDQPRWEWVSWGAVVATLGWLMASLLFSIYVSNFGHYDKTYGSVGAVVILMLWFYLSAYIVLAGAEMNAELEHQTRRDTTRGAPEPMGRRRAFVADTLGEVPE